MTERAITAQDQTMVVEVSTQSGGSFDLEIDRVDRGAGDASPLPWLGVEPVDGRIETAGVIANYGIEDGIEGTVRLAVRPVDESENGSTRSLRWTAVPSRWSRTCAVRARPRRSSRRWSPIPRTCSPCQPRELHGGLHHTPGTGHDDVARDRRRRGAGACCRPRQLCLVLVGAVRER